MKTKRSVIAALAALNAVLLLLLVAQTAPLPAAMAQPGRGGGGGGYVCATARAGGRTFETLFIIDLATRRLLTFYPEQQGKLLPTPVSRDLDKDFGK